MGGIFPSAVLVLQSPEILFVLSILELNSSNKRTYNLSVGKTPVASPQQAARGYAKQCISAFCMLLMMLVNQTGTLMSAHQRDEIARAQFTAGKGKRGPSVERQQLGGRSENEFAK